MPSKNNMVPMHVTYWHAFPFFSELVCRLIRFAANDDEHHNGEEGTWGIGYDSACNISCRHVEVNLTIRHARSHKLNSYQFTVSMTTLESSIAVGRPRIGFILCSLCFHVVSAHASSFLGM